MAPFPPTRLPDSAGISEFFAPSPRVLESSSTDVGVVSKPRP
jgi:hypothetical protein